MVFSALTRAESSVVINYQGQTEQAGIPYHGIGYFKFAIIDDPITPIHNIWTHDGSNPLPGHEPEHAISISLESGDFFITLGAIHSNALITSDNSSLKDSDDYLRVWFSTDGHEFEQLSPDKALSDQTPDSDARSANTLDGISVVATTQVIGNSKKAAKVLNAAALATPH